MADERYIVVAEINLERFKERCNHEMASGYAPVGGMVVKGEGNKVEYFQPFILEAKKKVITRNTNAK